MPREDDRRRSRSCGRDATYRKWLLSRYVVLMENTYLPTVSLLTSFKSKSVGQVNFSSKSSSGYAAYSTIPGAKLNQALAFFRISRRHNIALSQGICINHSRPSHQAMCNNIPSGSFTSGWLPVDVDSLEFSHAADSEVPQASHWLLCQQSLHNLL